MSRVARRTHPQARRLRREATDAEQCFWFQSATPAGPTEVPAQVGIGPFITDFACIEAMLIVDLDGSQHLDAVEYDERRRRFLEAQGDRVLRFPNHDVLTNLPGAIEAVLHATGR